MPFNARDYSKAIQETLTEGVKALGWEDILANGLALIGITTGTGPVASFALKLGGKLSSKLAERATVHWSNKWLSKWDSPEDASDSTKDILVALRHASARAIDRLRTDWAHDPAYLKLKARDAEAAALTLEALASFRKDADDFLSSSDRLAALLANKKNQIALAQGRVDGDSRKEMRDALSSHFYGYDEAFLAFLVARFPDEWTLQFGLVLKSDTPVGTKAWRAYQLLWKESLQSSLESIGEVNAQTREILSWLRMWAENLTNTPIGQREETGLDALDAALYPVQERLAELKALAEHTLKNTEEIKGSVAEVTSTVRDVQGELRDLSADVRERPVVTFGPGAQVTQIYDNQSYLVSGLPNPYLGLRSFTYEQRGIFAGRESAVAAAVQMLTSPGSQRSILFVTGASGSGKSSFAQAGVLPALEQHYSQRRLRVERAVFRPSRHPLEMLADALLQLGLPPSAPAPQDLQHHDSNSTESHAHPLGTSSTFNAFVRENTPADKVNLLVVDQFEELFAQSVPQERQAFFSILTGLERLERSRTHIIVTMRSDYLPELFEVTLLYNMAKQGIDLRAMSIDELKAAIQRPVQVAYPGGEKRWEPALVERLARDATEDATYLPLLQVTLEAIWNGGSLTLNRYGTLTDAIEERAETIHAYTSTSTSAATTGQMETVYSYVHATQAMQRPRTSQEQAEIMDIFLNLVEVSLDDDRRKDVRHRRSRAELIAGRTLRARLLDELLAARLLSASIETQVSQQVEVVDIIHETLIRNWDRLQNAIATRRQELQQRVRFEQAVRDWVSNGRSDDYLLVGVRLAEARALDRRGDIALRNPDARDFLNGSVVRQEEAQQKALAEAKRQAEEAERRETEQILVNRRLRRRAMALVVMLVAALIAAGVAVMQTREAAQAQSRAERQGRVVRAQSLAAISTSQLDTDVELSVLLATEAIYSTIQYGEDAVPQAVDVLYQALEALSSHLRLILYGHTDVINDVAYSPDGRYILTASRDKTVKVWRAANGKLLFTIHGHKDEVSSAEYSPDGMSILTVGYDKTVKVWDAATIGREIFTLTHTDGVEHAEYSPDGKNILTEGGNTVKVWDAATADKEKLTLPDPGYVTHAEYSPDGKSILTEGGNTVKVWDAATGEERVTLTQTDSVTHAEYSPDSKNIVTTWGNTVKVWDAATGEERVTLTQTDSVTHAEFSPDGKNIVTVGLLPPAVKVWDAVSGEEKLTLTHTDSVTHAEFSPDGKSILTEGRSTTKVWDAATGEEKFTISRSAGVVGRVAYSPDSKNILTASGDNTVKVWDIVINSDRFTPLGHKYNVTHAEYSPDGKNILAVSVDTVDVWVVAMGDTVNVWDAATGKEKFTLTNLGYVTHAEFSPDSKNIVTIRLGRVTVWDGATGEEKLTLTDPGYVTHAEYSPDGKSILRANYNKTVKVWDAATGEEKLTFTQADSVTHAEYSPDGKSILTEGRSTVKVWDAATGEEKLTLTHTDSVTHAEYSPDGKSILTASYDKTVKVWDAATGEERVTLTQADSVTHAEYSPDGKNIVTASRAGGVRQYILDFTSLLELVKSWDIRSLTAEERATYLGER